MIEESWQSRRKFLAGLATVPLVAACGPAATLDPPASRTLYLDEVPEREVFIDMKTDSEAQIHGVPGPKEVSVAADLEPGQILVHQERRVIQHVYAEGRAREYPVGLGRLGLEFSGEAVIARKAHWPSWRPTDAMISRDPGRYAKYASGVPGGPGNPLGARALYLYRNGIDTYYRIHGTDAPETVGSYVSNGCIRMLNEHVIELHDRVAIGTIVRVI